MSYRHPPFLYDDPIVNNLITMGNDEPPGPPDYYTNLRLNLTRNDEGKYDKY